MVRTRFAPSPTGFLHIGGARTALFAYLFAKQQGGEFILRIEDTDKERSTEKSTQAIFESLNWLGLGSDGPVYFQSKRSEIYQEKLEMLLDAGCAYRCTCTSQRLEQLRAEQLERREKPKYDGHCRDQHINDNETHVVRFKNPQQGTVAFTDAVFGEIVVANSELDDVILCRSDGSPTYNLTATVDDMLMGMTHIIRGDDHLNNTPRQINLLQALGGECPIYAHVPMILNETGQRLSKRHDAVSVGHYRDIGIVPQALINYLARLGWSHGNQELFSMAQLLELFTLDGIHRSPATFSQDKLVWFNQQHLQSLPVSAYQEIYVQQLKILGADTAVGPDVEKVLTILKGQGKTVQELAFKTSFLYHEKVTWDMKVHELYFVPKTWEALATLVDVLKDVNWSISDLSSQVKLAVKSHGMKFPELAQPLRILLTGSTASPSIDKTLFLLGRNKTLERLEAGTMFFKSKGDVQ